jgi:hypothetical protein
LHKVEGADVIQAGGVIAMGVSKNNRVKAADLLAQHLLSEVRTRVDDERVTPGLDEDGSAEALVAKIDGAAHFACAANHWHTL